MIKSLNTTLALHGLLPEPLVSAPDVLRATGTCECGHVMIYRLDAEAIQTLVRSEHLVVCPKCRRTGTSTISYSGGSAERAGGLSPRSVPA
jgi:hypothetical protein